MGRGCRAAAAGNCRRLYCCQDTSTWHRHRSCPGRCPVSVAARGWATPTARHQTAACAGDVPACVGAMALAKQRVCLARQTLWCKCGCVCSASVFTRAALGREDRLCLGYRVLFAAQPSLLAQAGTLCRCCWAHRRGGQAGGLARRGAATSIPFTGPELDPNVGTLRRCCWGTARRLPGWRSRPTRRCYPTPFTGPDLDPRFGTLRRCCWATARRWPGWRSRPTRRCWPPAPPTAACASGTRAPVRRAC